MQKYIISISVTVVIATLGYLILQNTIPSQIDEVKNSEIKTSLLQSGVETDSGERLKTLSNSGTQWGMTPFGSGKPLTEESIHKVDFNKPNTEWKTRSLSGITYVFGEGNPVGIAMSLEQIDAMTKTCETDISLVEKGICDPESGLMSYLTPEIEKHLLLALSDSNWGKLATECENNFRAREGVDALNNARNDASYLIFDRVFASGFLDIEKFIFIEPTTGLKLLNNNLTISLAKFVMNGMYDGASRGEPQPNPYGDCVDRYGKDIAQHLVATTNLYMRPLQLAEGLIPQKSIIPFSFH